MNFFKILYSFAFVLFLFCFSSGTKAQFFEGWNTDSVCLDTTQQRVLSLCVEGLTFFHDNEYDSPVAKGYSLPGARLLSALSYQPLSRVRLSLGACALLFNGANKYPNYAYHDIGTWKGSQYQSGLHLLPFLRAQADFQKISLVMGNIYGAQYHRLIEPMFNPEQQISTDPEMGFQLLLKRRYIHLDTWINWQSYIFKMDTHQEAFTVGTNATLRWWEKHPFIRWTLPLQFLIQHRGGEQDTIASGVETLCNASVGLRMDFHPAWGNALSQLSTELNLLGCYQQSGRLWPFDSGMAWHTALGATLWRRLEIKLGHVGIPRQYANLFGNPFFSTLSIKTPGKIFRGMQTSYLHINYFYNFTSAYRLGTRLEAMYAQTRGYSGLVFNFGVYFCFSPAFVLKRF